MWLLNSSIGKKLIMSISGVFLVLFMTFHACMNFVAVINLGAYDAVCKFLGANWYAVVGSAVLAGGFLIHIIFATWLTLTNQKARGNEAYAVNGMPKNVEWASKNMYVLGFIILMGIVLHLTMFWAKMQLSELANLEIATDGKVIDPAAGSEFLIAYFKNPIFCILYLLWFAAIWFHMTHGIWSAFQTLGWNNNTWICRWKTISYIVATILMLMFAFTVVFFYVGNCIGLFA